MTGAPVAATRGTALDARRIADALAEARARTLALLDLPEATQRAQVSPLMSPMVWDLAHIGNYEELWLLRELDGRRADDPDLDDLYNAFEHPRWERPTLPILGPTEARDYLARTRRQVLELLETVADAAATTTGVAPATEAPADDRAHEGSTRRDRLLAGGFVYGMVVQHEHQHDETLLATRQLMGEAAPPVPGARPTPAADPSPPAEGMAVLPGGRFLLGTDDDPWAYDNERPGHVVDLAPFALDVTPVTVAAFRGFVQAGGYDDPRWWTTAGWAWRTEEDLRAPQFWSPDGDRVLRFGTWRPLADDEPVQHVCWYEADAFARWAGKRLPTEAEWEYAATIDATGAKRRYPWGDTEPTEQHANLGQRHDGPCPVGSHPAGANPWGVLGLIGDVWEWTSSGFDPYPGFRPFPYREYSEVFFGTRADPDDPAVDREAWRVLRGGSWAAHPVAVRGTFRNWDYPIRRQIFSGFRCAADAPVGVG